MLHIFLGLLRVDTQLLNGTADVLVHQVKKLLDRLLLFLEFSLDVAQDFVEQDSWYEVFVRQIHVVEVGLLVEDIELLSQIKGPDLLEHLDVFLKILSGHFLAHNVLGNLGENELVVLSLLLLHVVNKSLDHVELLLEFLLQVVVQSLEVCDLKDLVRALRQLAKEIVDDLAFFVELFKFIIELVKVSDDVRDLLLVLPCREQLSVPIKLLS